MIWLAKAGKWIISSRVAQIALALIAAFGLHKARVWQEKQEAVKEERKEAKAKAVEQKVKHEDSIEDARGKLHKKQEQRREREEKEDPRDRFGRDPFE